MTISHEQIAKRAFEIWEREGCPQNQELAHWLRAEEELREEQEKPRGRKTKRKAPAELRTPRGENL